jgi:hypothetical protein
MLLAIVLLYLLGALMCPAFVRYVDAHIDDPDVKTPASELFWCAVLWPVVAFFGTVLVLLATHVRPSYSCVKKMQHE